MQRGAGTPALTNLELCERLSGIAVSVSRSRAGRLLRQMNLQLQKSIHARERDPKVNRRGGQSSPRPSRDRG